MANKNLKQLEKIIQDKLAFIEDKITDLKSFSEKLQKAVYELMIEDLLPYLETQEGVILSNTYNLNVYKDFNVKLDTFFNLHKQALATNIIEGFLTLNKFEVDYFSNPEFGLSKKTFTTIEKNVVEIMSQKIGISSKTGLIAKDTFLDRFITAAPARDEIKQFVIGAISKKSDFKEFKASLKEQILGTETKNGLMQNYIDTYAYDTFSQYSNAQSNLFADELGLTYFVYTGGLVKDSREFCIEHDDKVYSREEAADWSNWKNSKGEIPGYIANFPNYTPTVDMGGFNCRHTPRWISDSLAKSLGKNIK